MKCKLFTFSIILFSSIRIFGQTPDWIWAKSAGGVNYDVGNSIATDNLGNTYVTGYFESPAITIGNIVLNNASGSGGINKGDFFIAKYDPLGNVAWAKSVGGNYPEKGISITTDINGNVYVTGIFCSIQISFGGYALSNAYTGYPFTSDIFIVKYSSTGTLLWDKRAGGIYDDMSTCITTDKIGNVYLSGYFGSSSITFGSTILTNTGSLGTDDFFLVKYNSSGGVIWAKSAGGIGNDVVSSIATDSLGNLYITGNFKSSFITLGGNTLINSSCHL